MGAALPGEPPDGNYDALGPLDPDTENIVPVSRCGGRFEVAAEL